MNATPISTTRFVIELWKRRVTWFVLTTDRWRIARVWNCQREDRRIKVSYLWLECGSANSVLTKNGMAATTAPQIDGAIAWARNEKLPHLRSRWQRYSPERSLSSLFLHLVHSTLLRNNSPSLKNGLEVNKRLWRLLCSVDYTIPMNAFFYGAGGSGESSETAHF